MPLSPKSDYELYTSGRGCLGPSGSLPVAAQLRPQWWSSGPVILDPGLTVTPTAAATSLFLAVSGSGHTYYRFRQRYILTVPHAAVIRITPSGANSNTIVAELNPEGYGVTTSLDAIYGYASAISSVALAWPDNSTFQVSQDANAQYWQFQLDLFLQLRARTTDPATLTITAAIG